MECLSKSKYRRAIITLILGQILAVFMSGSGTFSQLLQINYNVNNVPTSQTLPNYILLFLTFGVALFCRGDVDRVIREDWWKYIPIAILDLETNYFNVLSYQYTTIASAQSILNGVTITTTVILSLFFLKAQYKLVHYVGVIICIAGIASLFVADSEGNNSSHGRNELLGDALCVAGGLSNAIVFVAMEYMINSRSMAEYLGMLSIFGVLVSSLQLCILERHSVAMIEWNIAVVLLFAGFVGCLYMIYILCSVMLKIASAVICDLCLLCANVYNLVFGILLFSNVFSSLYLLSFSSILIGLVIYNTRVATCADTDQSPFTILYWQTYCQSLWCEWRCVCQKRDSSESATPLLNATNGKIPNGNIANHIPIRDDNTNLNNGSKHNSITSVIIE